MNKYKNLTWGVKQYEKQICSKSFFESWW